MAAHGLFLGFMLLIFAGKTETRLSVASSVLQFSYICLLIYDISLLTKCFICFLTNLSVRISNCSFVFFGMVSFFQKEKLNNEVIPSHRDLAPDFKEKYFKQILDHFNYNSLGNGTYDQRYLITGDDNLPHYHLVELLLSF